jgi:hypothetical protein
MGRNNLGPSYIPEKRARLPICLQEELEKLILTAQEMLFSPSQKGCCKPTLKLPRGPPSKPQSAKAPTRKEVAPSAKGDGVSATRSTATISDSSDCKQVVDIGRRRVDVQKSRDGSQAGKVGHAGDPDRTRREAGEEETENGSESGSFCSTRSSPDVELVSTLRPSRVAGCGSLSIPWCLIPPLSVAKPARLNVQDVEIIDSKSRGRQREDKDALGVQSQGVNQQSPTADRLDKELVKLRLVLQEHMGRRTVA